MVILEVRKIKMEDKLNELKSIIESHESDYLIERGYENRIIINMNIDNDDDFLDKFSKSDYPIVNSDIYEYINKYTSSFKPNEKYILRIHSNCIDDVEKDIYSKAIKNYYIAKYLNNNVNLKRNRIISLILGIIGGLILGLVIFLEYNQKSEFWMRIFDIVSWVFIWEAVDILFFKCNELKIEKLRTLNFIDMKIEYK